VQIGISVVAVVKTECLAYYSGIKVFNNLPSEIKNVAGNQKKFKIVLKIFLYTFSFYTLEEYFSQL